MQRSGTSSCQKNRASSTATYVAADDHFPEFTFHTRLVQEALASARAILHQKRFGNKRNFLESDTCADMGMVKIPAQSISSKIAVIGQFPRGISRLG